MMTMPTFDHAMPMTAFLGAYAAWLMPGLAVTAGITGFDFIAGDPARRRPGRVHLKGEPFARGAARIRAWGFQVASPTMPRSPLDVGLVLVPEAQSEAMEFQPVWPLKVSLADLAGPVVVDRVTRRDELQVRRRLFRGVAKIVKAAKSEAPAKGGGYLIAPHYWFIGTMLWTNPERGPDDDSDMLHPLGPTYRSVFDPRVRQYFHRVLRNLHIDAVYLEDGVGHRKLEKVLRCAFELHDIHGGRRRAEEQHFQGIPKVRVIIHEFEPGSEFPNNDYPEPKFDEMTRSRILHVFRDRGDSEELVDHPFDFSWEPSPMLVG
jgi:hypothetical protein